MGEMDLKKAEYYTNRELSWLGFNNRILGEARDASLPLFERLKFLSITASNLDEFFMIRVASLKDMVHAGYTKKDISGMTASGAAEKNLKRDTRTGRSAVFYLQSLSDPGSEKAGAENYFRARESERRAEKICGCLF